LVICPVCKKVGRVRRNRIVMTFCYPEKTISVPNISQLDTTSDAWDYAAKVCLRMSQRALRDPPANAKSDNEIAEAFYEHFRTLIPHTDSDINNFESIHGERIRQKLDSRHDSINPEDRISKTALSLLYGAIVCTIMSDLLSKNRSSFRNVKTERKSAYAIYTFYSQLLIDERAKTTWLGWFNIIIDSIIELSPSAAVKKYTRGIRGGSISRKQVKGRKPEVMKKLLDAVTYEPIFLKMFRQTGLLTRSNMDVSADILSRFEKFQFEVYHQEREYEYAWIIHEKSSSSTSHSHDDYFKQSKKTSLYSIKSKSRWCQISPTRSLRYVDAKDKQDNKQ
jgi:hypothetical protein